MEILNTILKHKFSVLPLCKPNNIMNILFQNLNSHEVTSICIAKSLKPVKTKNQMQQFQLMHKEVQ
jgi:hypothetical protein